MTKKPVVIETMAGWSYGKMAALLPKILTHGRRQDDQTDRGHQAGNAAPQCATVVRPFQYMDRMSTGKLTEEATPKARATRNSTFWSLKAMPSRMAAIPRPPRSNTGNLHFLRTGRRALLDHAGIEVVRDRGRTGQCQAGNHGQDGGEGNGRQEAEEDVAADGLGQVHDRHVAATDHLAANVAAFEEGRVGTDDGDGRGTEDDGDEEEQADETGGVEHRLAGFLAFGTVKKRIMMCGRPAVPKSRPSDSEKAETGSAISEPGTIIFRPFVRLDGLGEQVVRATSRIAPGSAA